MSDCNLSAIADILFQEDIINGECMEKIEKTAKNERRYAAIRILFRELIQIARKERSFRVVNALISALRDESGTQGDIEMANLVAASLEEAQLAVKTLHDTPGASQQGKSERSL